MLKLFTKIFGTKSERDLKTLRPYVEKINLEYKKLYAISDDELRAKTASLKQHIQAEMQELVEKLQECEKRLEFDAQLSPADVDNLYLQINRIKEQYDARLQEVLLDILPQAFAVVKETARRFKEHEQLVVTATAYDKALANTQKNIIIEGDQAIWKNQWEVTGHMITWDMVHYDEQLIGGIILHKGRIAEMATGEGKTLVATLPAFLNALVGKGVHIVTVNEYLAKRDAAWKKPIYQFHGLTVACIEDTPPYSPARRKAYQADIIYGTNNEFGFDYLRDNMATQQEEVVQRGHHYAIVDEVDSVLIDDARTPLIISGPVERDTEKEYVTFNPRVKRLYEAQKQLVNGFLQEVKSKIADDKDEETGLKLFRVYRGLPKYKPLIKYLSEPGIKQLLHKTENYYLQDNSRLMPEADEPLLFTIDEKHNTVELTEKGLEYMTQQGEDPNFFVLPDTATAVGEIEHDTALDTFEKEKKKQALALEYAVKSQRIHAVQQLLKAYALFEKDVDYIIIDGKAKIVDEQTGRVLEGRRYSDGLHQAIEAKEEIKIEKASQTYATITLQNYFRLYHKLAGMTGTAETEAGEFYDIYHLDVVVTPTHKAVIREDKDDKVYKTVREKFNAIIEEITTLAAQGRPVLVGTTSVEISELVSKMLNLRKIKHQVLNAKQHQKEAEIIAEAGKASTVTIATNMAGRGTDIKLSPEAKAAGGLAIIGTERHESRRVDRQLRGRSGRQGDVGSSQFFVSLEDSLMRLFISDRIAKIMDSLGLKEGEMIQHGMITRSIERAQKKVEQNNYGYRKRLLEYDNELNKQREIVYRRRRDALLGHRLRAETFSMLYAVAKNLVTQQGLKNNYEDLKQKLSRIGGILLPLTEEEFRSIDVAKLVELVYDSLLSSYNAKLSLLQEQATNIHMELLNHLADMKVEYLSFSFTDGERRLEVPVKTSDFIENAGEAISKSLERVVIIYCLDQFWQEHLRNMDELRQAVQNASYEQKDPLLVYKFESYELFSSMIARANEAIISYLLKSNLLLYKTRDERVKITEKAKMLGIEEVKQDILTQLSEMDGGLPQEKPKINPVRSQKIANRNERVIVQYQDGTIKKDVKFKMVEEDIASGKCILLESDES
ncbi:MAG: preprotein translocase subunit SecA [Candidatus Amoebophilus sp. 36-38]|nr:MAG: preprotein translocase subunit SecA [Candidatus Amoebophilus sp. 36-38]